MSIKIEVDLTSFGIEEDPETGELVPGPDLAQRIVDSLIARAERGITRGLEGIVEEAAKSQIEKTVKKRVAEILEGPIQRTDWYGNPKGEPTSVHIMTMHAVDQWLKPGDSRSNYSGNNRGTMGELIEGIVKKEAEAIVKPIVEDAKKSITSELVRQAAEAASAALVGRVVRP